MLKTQQIQHKSYLQKMKAVLIFIISTMVFKTPSFGQNDGGGKKLKFCGYKYKDSALLRKHFEQQLAFLQINSGDTIVILAAAAELYLAA